MVTGELIADNGKEFVSDEFRMMCSEKNIKHTTVNVESHRSNGRVERLIGIIREGLVKQREDTLEERIIRIVNVYNGMYHSAIGCTPIEAMVNETGNVRIENSPEGKYAKRFKKRWRWRFDIEQKVRIATRENIRNDAKEAKGRFIMSGAIMEVCEGDSYVVKLDDESGRLVKKRHYDLKRMESVRG